MTKPQGKYSQVVSPEHRQKRKKGYNCFGRRGLVHLKVQPVIAFSQHERSFYTNSPAMNSPHFPSSHTDVPNPFTSKHGSAGGGNGDGSSQNLHRAVIKGNSNDQNQSKNHWQDERL